MLYLTSWYEEKNPSRREELISCLMKTVDSSEVDHVHLLAEVEPPFRHEKMSFKLIGIRPTYDTFFKRANEIGQEGDIVVIANTDIYPSAGSWSLIQRIGSDECYALSRWDEDDEGKVSHFERVDSQDIWVFRYPIRSNIQGGFNIGIPGCDNRIAHELNEAGYRVLNPSRDVKFIHRHNSGVRNYIAGTHSVPPPYLRVKPDHILPVACTIDNSVTGVLHVGFDQPPLEKAFAKTYSNYSFIRWTDYKDYAALRKEIYTQFLTGKYQMVFFHVQTGGVITPELVQSMRESGVIMNPVFVNWTGDVRSPLPEWYISLGREMTITLFSNDTDVKEARRRGIKAEYLQIGFDDKIFTPGTAQAVWPEIVFLGNNYPDKFPLSPLRMSMVKLLRDHYGSRFGCYGGNWDKLANTNLMNNPDAEVDCLRGCKIAINLSHFNYERYSSDRIFRILGSGAFCLTRRYPRMEEEFTPGENVGVWDDLSELIEQIDHFLSADEDRKQIAINGAQLAHCCHTWEVRLEELKHYINAQR